MHSDLIKNKSKSFDDKSVAVKKHSKKEFQK